MINSNNINKNPTDGVEGRGVCARKTNDRIALPHARAY